MLKKFNKPKILVFIIFIFLMSLVKVDYRFEEIDYGKSVDDAEYYYSAITVGVDYDLDFSNQMEGVENRYLNKENNNIVPFHPIGSGILAAPFIIISNLLIEPFLKSNLVSFNFFIYSLVPIFYFFTSIKLLIISLNNLKISHDKKHLLFFILGTGVTYYSFDRFSMSHTYEFFSTSFIIYLTTKLIGKIKINQFYFFLLGFCIFLFLSIRFTNYFLFLIPAILLHLEGLRLRNIYLNPFFIIGTAVGSVLFLLHTKYLYGVYTFNQAGIVLSVENSIGDTYSNFFIISKLGENLKLVFNSLLNIFFGQEFGLLYFSPIIFVGLIYVLFFIYQKKYFLFLLLGASYLIPFFSVIVLQNTGFSFGYRYLFVLIPLNIIIYFKCFQQNKLIRNYLIIFSILGFLGYILFETTEYTSLSQDYLINSFGMETRYSNPDYLANLFKSIGNINSYLHIIFTSFIGVLLIKIINLFMSPSKFFGIFTTVTPEIEEMILNSISFSWMKVFIIYFLIYYFIRQFVKFK